MKWRTDPKKTKKKATRQTVLGMWTSGRQSKTGMLIWAVFQGDWLRGQGGPGGWGEGNRKRLDLAAVGDGDLGASLAAVAAVALYFLDDVHAVHDLTEDHMLPVQPEGETVG